MNSLEQLNTFASEDIDYGDEADFSITLSVIGNQTVSGVEGQDHQVPLGINIIDMISGPDTIYYQIDLTSATNMTVSWPTLPSGVTASNPQPNIYRITGVSSLQRWEQVKTPTIVVPRDYTGSYSYTVTFNAGSGNTVSWTVSASNSSGTELNTLTPNAVTYNEDETLTFGSSNVIQITDAENPNTDYYVLTATFSNSAGVLSSTHSMSGVTSVPGSLTLNNSKTNINSYLQGLQFVPTMDYDQTFTITWLLTNPGSGFETTASQTVNIGLTNEEILDMYLTRSYTEHQINLLFPSTVPQISETVSDALYTLNFQLYDNIGVIGTDFVDTRWNSVTKTFTASNLTKSQANSLMGQLYFYPYQNVNSNTTVTYRQSRNGTQQISQTFTLAGTPSATRISASGNQTVLEDAYFTTGPTAVYPNWDQSNWALLIQTTQNNSPVTNVARFDLPSGWNYIGNANTHSGIYKNYSSAGNISVYNGYLNDAAANVLATLTVDYTNSFTINRTLNLGGTFNGNTFSGGTNYYGNSNVTITAHDEYTIPASLVYEEDNILTFGGNIAIADLALNKQYTSTVRLESTSIGNLWYGNVNQGNVVTFSGTKTSVNNQLANIQFNPIANGYANGNVFYSQTQTTDNLVHATNVRVALNSTGNLPEPTVGDWSYSTNTGNTTNNADGFTVTQTLSGTSGYPVAPSGVSYTIGSIGNVDAQPVITSQTKTQVGNDTVLTLNGYWPVQSYNVSPFDPITSFDITTTATNNKNQTTVLSKPLYLHLDYIEDGMSDLYDTGANWPTQGYVFYKFTIRHMTSGVIQNFVTKINLNMDSWQNVIGNFTEFWVCRTEDYNDSVTNFQALTSSSSGTLQAGYRHILRTQTGTTYDPIISGVVSNPGPAHYPPTAIDQNITVAVRYGVGNSIPKGYARIWKSNLYNSIFNAYENLTCGAF